MVRCRGDVPCFNDRFLALTYDVSYFGTFTKRGPSGGTACDLEKQLRARTASRQAKKLAVVAKRVGQRSTFVKVRNTAGRHVRH